LEKANSSIISFRQCQLQFPIELILLNPTQTYSIWPRLHNDYQYAAVDGYTGENVEGYDAQEVWKKVHPDEDWDATRQKMAATRETAKSVMYRLVDLVWKQEEEQ